MTKQEYTERLQQIGICEDETERRDLIAQLIQDGGADYDTHATVLSERDQLQADNENLRSANMKLFLQIGDHNDPGDNPGSNPQKKEMKFEDLFDEKGGIK